MAKQKVQTEKPRAQENAEPQPQFSGMVDTVYLLTRRGYKMFCGEDAQSLMDEIREQGDDSEYICYEDGKPVYVAVRASPLRALAYPSPDQYGITSADLYSKAETYRDTISRVIEKLTKGKPSLFDQAKKIMTLTLPIVVMAALIFVIAVMIGGK